MTTLLWGFEFSTEEKPYKVYNELGLRYLLPLIRPIVTVATEFTLQQ